MLLTASNPLLVATHSRLLVCCSARQQLSGLAHTAGPLLLLGLGLLLLSRCRSIAWPCLNLQSQCWQQQIIIAVSAETYCWQHSTKRLV
jgi:hypothetical protein